MEKVNTHETSAISETTALLLAILFTILFVAPFYLSPTLRDTPLNRRDSPTNIEARVRAVGFTCLASTLITVFVLRTYCHASIADIFRLTGIFPTNIFDIPRNLLLVVILFIGPLYESLYVDSGWRSLGFRTFKAHWWDTWPGLRNHTVAPIGEEFVFRALVISLYLCAGASGPRIVWQSPLVFGVAHAHHLVEFLQHHTPRHQRWPAARTVAVGVLRSAFQFAYTSAFGFFAAFVFLRTGSLWAAIAVHSFCNFMGFPRLTGRVGQFEEDVVPRPPETDPSYDGRGPRNLGVQWTVLYYVLLVVGAVGFYMCLWPLTESSNALIRF